MRGRRRKERARAKERVVARVRVRRELRMVYVEAGGVLASGFAGRRACLVALLLLHHDGGGVLLGAQPSAPLDAQLLVQLGGRRLPRHRHATVTRTRLGPPCARPNPRPPPPPPPLLLRPQPRLSARLGRHIVWRWRARDERRPERVGRVPLDRVAWDRVAV